MIVVALLFGLIQVAICYQLFDQFEDPQTEYNQKGFEVLIFIMCGLLSFSYHQGCLAIYQKKEMADASTQHEEEIIKITEEDKSGYSLLESSGNISIKKKTLLSKNIELYLNEKKMMKNDETINLSA